MAISSASPALSSSRPYKAPEPSAALLALQEIGLELPTCRAISVSPSSNVGPNGSVQISPLSTVPTPSNFDKPPSLETPEIFEGRASSTGSTKSIVSRILELYVNSSQYSLVSEYEEMIPFPATSEDEEPTNYLVHQPKAYRDTIAPLLEYQFSSQKMDVPPAPSPTSLASSLHLDDRFVRAAMPILHLTRQDSLESQAGMPHAVACSQSSIQITPEMTPPPVRQVVLTAPSFRQFSHDLLERQIALEVPDVRDAESWYDQLLSPVSPEDIESRPRDSQLSAVSPEVAAGYQRQLAYDTLVPPVAAPKTSPNLRPVNRVLGDHLPGPIIATVTKVVDGKIVPPPPGFSRSWSSSKLSEGSKPAYQTRMRSECESHVPKSQHANPIESRHVDGSPRAHLPQPPSERFSDMSGSEHQKVDLAKTSRPVSPFSRDPTQRESRNGIGTQLKAALRFGWKRTRKEQKPRAFTSKQTKTPNGSISPGHVAVSSKCSFQDDLQTYKYGYWKSRASAPNLPRNSFMEEFYGADHLSVQSVARNLSIDLEGVSAASRPASAISRSQLLRLDPPHPSDIAASATGKAAPRPPIKTRVPVPAIPLSEYQKYGPEIWNEKKKRQRLKNEEKAARAAEKEAKRIARGRAKTSIIPDRDLTALRDNATAKDDKTTEEASMLELHDFFRSRPLSSRAYSHAPKASHSTVASGPKGDAASVENTSWKLVGSQPYNNDLFEAIGGDKTMGRYVSRLMMSSEERRKQKVKQSITVIGGGKLNMAKSTPAAE